MNISIRDMKAFDTGFEDSQLDQVDRKPQSEDYSFCYIMGYEVGRSGKYNRAANSLTEKLKVIYDKAVKIFVSDMSWEEKYTKIFSEDISRAVNVLVELHYYDPDTSYEEDVRAFIGALREKCQDLDIG
jgi:hypothetical protein